jgi:hypothetical protein
MAARCGMTAEGVSVRIFARCSAICAMPADADAGSGGKRIGRPAVLCGALDPRPYALSVNPDDNLAGIHQISCSSLELAKSACPNDFETVAIAAGDCDVREALQGTKAGRILDLELQEPTRTPRSSVIAYLDSDAMGGCASDD